MEIRTKGKLHRARHLGWLTQEYQKFVKHITASQFFAKIA